MELKININEILYDSAKEKLEMSFDDFVEYSLSLYLNTDDEVAKLFKKGIQLQKQLDTIQKKLCKLEKNNNEINKEDMQKALDTINRIHNKLGYIGKNQLRKIANQNNIPTNYLINYIDNDDKYSLTNFCDAPKQR